MATLRIDQVGLPAGTDDRSRSDGLGTGAVVTLTSTGPGVTHTFTLLWVPEDDATAVASFSQGGTTATFTPDSSSVGGTYRIRLRVVDASGTPTETIRLFSIRTNGGLRIPALNEQADETASLENNGATQISASEFNEDAASGPFASGNYGGWYSAMSELIAYVDDHDQSHIQGGTDEITAQDLGSGAAPANQIMESDGAGGWNLISTPGGGGGGSPSLEGLPTANLQFLMDAGDRDSYPGSGTTVTDLIGSVAGTMASITITDSHFNFGGVGSGSNIDFGTKPAGLVNIFSGGGTLAAWARASDFTNTLRLINSDEDTGAGWNVFTTTTLDTGSALRFVRDYSTSNGVWESDEHLQLNEWFFLVITYDDSSTANDPTFYLNGKQVTGITEVLAPSGSPNSDSGQPLLIGVLGNDPSPVQEWAGDIDIVALYDRVLSANEIEQWYDITAPRFIDAGARDNRLNSLPQGFSNYNMVFGFSSDLKESVPADVIGVPEVYDLAYGRKGVCTNVNRIGGNLDFNGASSYINFGALVPEAKDIWAGGGTVSFLVNSDGVAFGRIADTTDPDGGGWNIFVADVTTWDQKCRLQVDFSTTAGIWEWDIGKFYWSYITITYNSDSVSNNPTVYVNGRSVTVSEFTTPVGTYVSEPTTNHFIVGAADDTPTFSLNGELNKLFMYDRTMSSTEALLSYQAVKDKYTSFLRQELVTTQVITGTDTILTDTINAYPESAAEVKVYLNGILQRQGAGFDYELVNGRRINWLASSGTAVDMDTSDELLVVYRA